MATEAAAGAFGVILDKVSFVNNVPLLVKATSDDERPTPGFMYQEINRISFASGSHCQTLLDYLVDRLDKNSCHVKLKVLQILKFIISNGHPDFRQGLRRRSTGIVDATKYSGPPDPLHGNAQYLMVRKVAQEVSQLLFDEALDEEQSGQAGPVKGLGGMGVAPGGGGRMEGFGNTPDTSRVNKTIGDTIVSGIKDFAEKVIDPYPQHTYSLDTNNLFEGYKAVQVEASFLPFPAQNLSEIQQVGRSKSAKRKKGHQPGVPGGGWDESDDNFMPCTTVNYNSSIQASSKSGDSEKSMGLGSTSAGSGHYPRSQTSSGGADRLESCKIENWKAEEELVYEFVNANNNPLPKRIETSAFIKSCSAMNCEKVIDCIVKNLQSSNPDFLIMRALMLLECLIRTDLVMMDHMALVCSEPLIHIYKSTTGTPHSKARKLIRQLEKLCTNPELFKDVPVLSAIKSGKENNKAVDRDETDVENIKEIRMEEVDGTDINIDWKSLKIPFVSHSTEPSSLLEANDNINQSLEKEDFSIGSDNVKDKKESISNFLYDKRK